MCKDMGVGIGKVILMWGMLMVHCWIVMPLEESKYAAWLKILEDKDA